MGYLCATNKTHKIEFLTTAFTVRCMSTESKFAAPKGVERSIIRGGGGGGGSYSLFLCLHTLKAIDFKRIQ